MPGKNLEALGRFNAHIHTHAAPYMPSDIAREAGVSRILPKEN